MRPLIGDWRFRFGAGSLALALTGCASAPKPAPPQGIPPHAPSVAASVAFPEILPSPSHMTVRGGAGLSVGPGSVIRLSVFQTSETPAALRLAGGLATLIARSTGALPPITSVSGPLSNEVPPRALDLVLLPEAVGRRNDEGYELSVDDSHLQLRATTPAGLFYGIQTIRQLLPARGEYEAVMFQQPRPATIPPLIVVDGPRYEWRGAMLDVARHFFSVDDVKRYVDLLALHKMNRLHLHLADDQGWRIEIRKWPDLTAKGSASEVGGGPGGFYTQAQYGDIVAYAADRFITIVPEIDMPGHINAALASYAELNCNGQAPPVFTGTDVGFSAMCVDKEVTYRFIDDVVGEIAGMTKGPYFHMGGDEVKKLTPEQYRAFVERVQAIVGAHGRQMIGWDEIAATSLLSTSIVQHWRPDAAHGELARAPHLILSPGNRTYLDMKYDRDTALGLSWAGLIPVRVAYDWDPATLVPEAPAPLILGVEAPMWSETVANIHDVEFLAMPRLAAVAEIGWSPAQSRDWERFRVRLGAQGPRWVALGINFYRAPEVPWRQ